MTGFEFHLTLSLVKKIKHLAMQKSEKRGRISANPQPHATRKISVVPARQKDPPGIVRQAGGHNEDSDLYGHRDASFVTSESTTVWPAAGL